MKIIDRYLLRQFLQTFLICFCSLNGLFIVFHAFSNLDEFMAYGEKRGGWAPVMIGFYSYQSIFFFDRTSGMVALTSAMFTVTWIQRHNELTALMAAGLPKGRIVAPVIAACIGVSLLAAASRELVIPRFRAQLSRNPRDLSGDLAQKLSPRYDNETDILLRGQQTFANELRIHQPNFLLPPDLHKHGKQLVAEDAYYQPPQADRPGGYLLKGVQEPKSLPKKPSIVRSGKKVIITPRDAPGWLEPGECFLVSDVDFEQLTGGQGWRQFSSTLTLIKGLNNRSLDFGADVRVAIHARLVQPLMDATLLFLGMPLVLSRASRNVFLASALCLAVTTIFMLVALASQYLGANVLIEPALAAWLPLLIFVPIAMAMSDPFRE